MMAAFFAYFSLARRREGADSVQHTAFCAFEALPFAYFNFSGLRVNSLCQHMHDAGRCYSWQICTV